MVVFYLLCTFPYCDICLLDISPQYILQPPTAVTWRDFVFNSDIFLRSWEILVCIYFVLSHQELVRFSFLEKKIMFLLSKVNACLEVLLSLLPLLHGLHWHHWKALLKIWESRVRKITGKINHDQIITCEDKIWPNVVTQRIFVLQCLLYH